MDINTFADRYSVKVRREECGDGVVVGKHGNVYEGFNCRRLGVCLLFTTVQKWNRVRRHWKRPDSLSSRMGTPKAV
jgi:hypothetical protein